jgi:HSP20 family protein
MHHYNINFKPFQSIIDEVMNHSLSDVFGGGFVQKSPKINITEHDQEFTFDIAAPGMSKEDFKIQVVDGKLYISADKQIETPEKAPQSIKQEWNFHKFERQFKLGDKVDATAIHAAYVHGILTIYLPKKEEHQTSEKIDITIK